MDTTHIKPKTGESDADFIARLLVIIDKESDQRSYYAKETSRLLSVVESGARMRAEMVSAAVLAEQEACAHVAIADGAASAAVFDMRGACAGERIAMAIHNRRG